MFYFSLKFYSEDIDKEALLFGTPMYFNLNISQSTHLFRENIILNIPHVLLFPYVLF